jgi:hypothetical protein
MALVGNDVLEEGIASIIRVTSRVLVTANVVPCSLILPILMMEAIRSSETSVLTRLTWRHIQEDGILHSHHRKNLNLTLLNYTAINEIK